jgi:hypothetical protein
MSLEQIASIVARITSVTGEGLGTAFLVRNDLVLTCAHCLGDIEKQKFDQSVHLVFESRNINQRVDVDLGDIDSELDVAVLKLKPPIPAPMNLIPLSARPFENDQWKSIGYPALQHSNKGTFTGAIQQVDTTAGKRRWPAMELQCDQADKEIAGTSGAPIVSNGAIVGIMVQQLLNMSVLGEKSGAYERVYALKIGTVTDFLKRFGVDAINYHNWPYTHLTAGVERVSLDGKLDHFLARYLGRPEQSIAFGGRSLELKELDNWFDGPLPFGLLVAESGRGKSALLVRWISQIRKTNRAAFVPVSLGEETAEQEDVLRMVAARLRHVTGVGGVPSNDLHMVTAEIAGTLKAGLSDERKLLVVVDGIDEAKGWRARDLNWRQVGPGVKILVSARREGQRDVMEWREELGWRPDNTHDFRSLRTLDRSGVREAIESLGERLPSWLSDKEPIRWIHELSDGGDPLLVSLLLDSILEKIARTVPALLPSDLHKLKPGYKGFFDAWWEDLRGQNGNNSAWNEDAIKTVAGFLSILEGPASPEELYELLSSNGNDDDLDHAEIDEALKSLKRIVVPRGSGVGYSHPKLAEYIRERFGKASRAGEQRVLALGRQSVESIRQGRPIRLSRYLADHYVQHLQKAPDRVEDLYALVSGQWFRAKQEVNQNNSRWWRGQLLMEIRAAWSAAENRLQSPSQKDVARHVAILSKCALFQASLECGYFAAPPDLLREMLIQKMIDPDWAMEIALAQTNYWRDLSQTRLISRISDLVDDQLLERALDSRTLEDLSRLPICASLAERSNDASRLTSCERLVQNLSGVDKAWGLYWIGRQTGLPPRSWFNNIKDASSIHPFKRLRVLAAAISRLPESYRAQAAQELITELGFEHQLQHASGDPHGLDILVDILLGDYLPGKRGDQLLQNIDRIQSSNEGAFDKRMAEAAPVLAARGLKTEAWQRVEKIHQPFFRAKGFALLVPHFGQPAFDRALQELDGATVDDDVLRAMAIAALAALSAASDHGKAESVVRKIPAERFLEEAEYDYSLLGPVVSFAGPDKLLELEEKILFPAEKKMQSFEAEGVIRILAKSWSKKRLREVWNRAKLEERTDIQRALASPLASKGDGEETYDFIAGSLELQSDLLPDVAQFWNKKLRGRARELLSSRAASHLEPEIKLQSFAALHKSSTDEELLKGMASQWKAFRANQLRKSEDTTSYGVTKALTLLVEVLRLLGKRKTPRRYFFKELQNILQTVTAHDTHDLLIIFHSADDLPDVRTEILKLSSVRESLSEFPESTPKPESLLPDSRELFAQQWITWLNTASHRGRANLLRGVAHWAPAIREFGGTSALTQIIDAIDEAGAVWP